MLCLTGALLLLLAGCNNAPLPITFDEAGTGARSDGGGRQDAAAGSDDRVCVLQLEEPWPAYVSIPGDPSAWCSAPGSDPSAMIMFEMPGHGHTTIAAGAQIGAHQLPETGAFATFDSDRNCSSFEGRLTFEKDAAGWRFAFELRCLLSGPALPFKGVLFGALK